MAVSERQWRKEVQLAQKKQDRWDEMRVNVDQFVVQVEPALNTFLYRSRLWAVASSNELVVSGPFGNFVEEQQFRMFPVGRGSVTCSISAEFGGSPLFFGIGKITIFDAGHFLVGIREGKSRQ